MPFYYASFFNYSFTLYSVNCFHGMVFDDFNLDIFHPRHIRPFRDGDEYLRAMGLDPATHKEWKYGLALGLYALLLTVLGYFVVKRSVGRSLALRHEGESARERCGTWTVGVWRSITGFVPGSIVIDDV